MVVFTKRLNDPQIIKEFLIQPELWDRIAETGQRYEDFEVPIDDRLHWVGLFEDDRLFGIVFIHATNVTTAVAHINIQKQDRYKHSQKAGFLALKYVIDMTDFNKINTTVPVMYPAVIKFVESLGFAVEGLDRKSINKDSQLVDQVSFGITRQEIIRFLQNKGA